MIIFNFLIEVKKMNDWKEFLSKKMDDFYESWDPDFVKLTSEEKERVDRSDAEMKAGIYYTEDEVWD